MLCCGDGTQIDTDKGLCYLATTEDLSSHRILGDARSAHHDAALAGICRRRNSCRMPGVGRGPGDAPNWSALDKATAESFNSTVTSDPGDYALDLAGIGLGVFVAWTLIDWPAALTIIFGISLVLHGKVLVRQFREAARTDPETGLLKLPSWTKAAQQRIARVDDSGRPTVHLSDTTVS